MDAPEEEARAGVDGSPDGDPDLDHDFGLIERDAQEIYDREAEAEGPPLQFSPWPAVGLIGVLLVVIGFCLPMASNVVDGHRTTISGAAFALTRGPLLWLVPAVSWFVAYVLFTGFIRPVRPGLLRAAPFLVALGAGALGYVALGLFRGADAFGRTVGLAVAVELELGLVVMVVGLGLAFAGTLALVRAGKHTANDALSRG